MQLCAEQRLIMYYKERLINIRFPDDHVVLHAGEHVVEQSQVEWRPFELGDLVGPRLRHALLEAVRLLLRRLGLLVAAGRRSVSCNFACSSRIRRTGCSWKRAQMGTVSGQVNMPRRLHTSTSTSTRAWSQSGSTPASAGAVVARFELLNTRSAYCLASSAHS